MVKNEKEEDFQQVQQEYSYWYSKLLLCRSFMLQNYDMRPPNWATDILPEKMYLGCLLSDEDFIHFVTKTGRLSTLRPEGVKQYEQSLQEKVALEDSQTKPSLNEEEPVD
jgi:hypothetical protein